MATPALAADEPAPAEEATATDEATDEAMEGPSPVYGSLRTYVRLWEDVSPKDRAATRYRLPLLATVHVGTYKMGVEGLSAEILGYGELEAIEPLHGPFGRGDLLIGTLAWRGLPDRMLTVIGGRQLLHVAAANNAILDGLYARLAVPGPIILEAWGGWTAEPGLDSELGRWQAGARVAYDAWDHGHLGVSFAHERDGGQVSREVLGVDLAWRTFPWLRVVGHAFVDTVEMDLDDISLRVDADATRELAVHAAYRRYNPQARIPKTSIFSVFAADAYDEVAGSIGWYPARSNLSLFGRGSVIVYADGSVGGRLALRPRLVLDAARGEVVGLELGRVEGPDNGYWDARVYGVWRPIDRLTLTADAEQAFFDHDIQGHGWSTFARGNASFDILEGLHVLLEVSATVDHRFEQSWLGMLRISYDFSERSATQRLLR